MAVTRSGRLFDARTGELSQAPAGGSERLLEELARRDELVAASERAAGDEAAAQTALERAGAAVAEADAAREEAENTLRARAARARRGRRRTRAGPSGSSRAGARRPTTAPRRCAAPS